VKRLDRYIRKGVQIIRIVAQKKIVRVKNSGEKENQAREGGEIPEVGTDDEEKLSTGAWELEVGVFSEVRGGGVILRTPSEKRPAKKKGKGGKRSGNDVLSRKGRGRGKNGRKPGGTESHLGETCMVAKFRRDTIVVWQGMHSAGERGGGTTLCIKTFLEKEGEEITLENWKGAHQERG